MIDQRNVKTRSYPTTEEEHACTTWKVSLLREISSCRTSNVSNRRTQSIIMSSVTHHNSIKVRVQRPITPINSSPLPIDVCVCVCVCVCVFYISLQSRPRVCLITSPVLRTRSFLRTFLLLLSVNSLSSTSVNRHSRNFFTLRALAPKEALLCRFPESTP